MADMQFHEAAGIFPLMEDEAFDELVESIREDGLTVGIELLDGKIIDGRNRYRACLLAGVEPEYVAAELGDHTPTKYVWLLNGPRRHMKTSQWAMVAARMKDQYAAEAKERKLAGKKLDLRENLPEGSAGRARDLAGEAVGVSGKTVDQATTVLDKGTPALIKAVDAGTMPVSQAAKLAALPKSDQKAALKGGSESVKAAVAPKYPASDKTVEVLRHLSFLMEEIRQDYGSFPAMLKHKDWDKSETDIVVSWIKSFAHTFGQMEKELP